MSETILKIEHENQVFEIYQDGYNSHWELDELFDSVFFKSRHRDYKDLGKLISGPIKEVPIYAYVHGNISLSLTPFNCRFDSGVFGYIYFKDGEFGKDDVGLDGFIRSWSALLNGEIYGFTLSQIDTCETCSHRDENIIDSVGGFYGYDSYKELAISMIENTNISDDFKNKIISEV
jgi:hypothetical protein